MYISIHTHTEYQQLGILKEWIVAVKDIDVPCIPYNICNDVYIYIYLYTNELIRKLPKTRHPRTSLDAPKRPKRCSCWMTTSLGFGMFLIPISV